VGFAILTHIETNVSGGNFKIASVYIIQPLLVVCLIHTENAEVSEKAHNTVNTRRSGARCSVMLLNACLNKIFGAVLFHTVSLNRSSKVTVKYCDGCSAVCFCFLNHVKESIPECGAVVSLHINSVSFGCSGKYLCRFLNKFMGFVAEFKSCSFCLKLFYVILKTEFSESISKLRFRQRFAVVAGYIFHEAHAVAHYSIGKNKNRLLDLFGSGNSVENLCVVMSVYLDNMPAVRLKLASDVLRHNGGDVSADLKFIVIYESCDVVISVF